MKAKLRDQKAARHWRIVVEVKAVHPPAIRGLVRVPTIPPGVNKRPAWFLGTVVDVELAAHAGGGRALINAGEAELAALRAKLAAAERVLRVARCYFPVDRNDAMRWDYDDDEDRDDLIAMRRDIDALIPYEEKKP